MNQEIKKQWIEALRSREYKQTTGRLRHTEEDGTHSYCCLGVLCDLHSKAMHEKWVGNEYCGAQTFLPNEVNQWVDPLLKPLDYRAGIDFLVGQNDGGASFSTIAKFLETDPRFAT
jgi:hypothetical protein